MSMSERTNIFAKYEDAKLRIIKLEAAINKHRNSRGNESCWLNDQELYKVIDEKMPDRKLPNKEEFLEACERYYDEQNK
jgi:hypothetical protein